MGIHSVISDNWTLTDVYQGTNFFDQFTFYTDLDPWHGYVNYVNQTQAQNMNLINTTSTSVYIGADYTSIANGRGRNAVRISSNKLYDYGLFMLRLSHMPFGCGTWPLFQLFGIDWPNNGLMDIIEGVDNQIYDHTTLHALNNCNFSGQPKNFTGTEESTNCGYDHGGGGCQIRSNNNNSYGQYFDDNNGGLYAIKWNDIGISLWFWSTNNIPSNAESNSPDPTQWGLPYAAWNFGVWCEGQDLFKKMNITFALTFCGVYDGGAFTHDCVDLNKQYGSCQGYVQNYPQGFEQAYWIVDYVKVFQ